MKPRILFIDDEEKVLQGLKRMLRSMRHEWDVDFAISGQDGLEFMTREKFDVVVSDLRMPGMSGAQFLAEVRERHPQVLRFILSGHAEIDLTLQSVKAAHQYLSKPSPPDTLKRTVGRALALKEVLPVERLRSVVSSVDALPSVPAAHLELKERIESSDTSVEQVAETISRDVGMSAKVLQVVSSAFFGTTQHLSSPAQAASLLGLEIIRNLSESSRVFSSFADQDGSFDIEAGCRHSVECAECARSIALTQDADEKKAAEAYVAGLLHDSGKWIFAAFLAGEYEDAVERAARDDVSGWEAEQQVVGASHAELGAYLLGLWGLPDSIVEAVAFHHRPSAAPSQAFTALTCVHAANALLHEETHPGSRVDLGYLQKLGLEREISSWREHWKHVRASADSTGDLESRELTSNTNT